MTLSIKREQFWELRETPAQREARGRALRAIYALVDPNGWDARRLTSQATTVFNKARVRRT